MIVRKRTVNFGKGFPGYNVRVEAFKVVGYIVLPPPEESLAYGYEKEYGLEEIGYFSYPMTSLNPVRSGIYSDSEIEDFQNLEEGWNLCSNMCRNCENTSQTQMEE